MSQKNVTKFKMAEQCNKSMICETVRQIIYTIRKHKHLIASTKIP